MSDGYFVRHQDGDLKYMVAFRKPEVNLVPRLCFLAGIVVQGLPRQMLEMHHHQEALRWCMVVQECPMYAEWPPSALVQWKEEKGNDGALLFRGPRSAWEGWGVRGFFYHHNIARQL